MRWSFATSSSKSDFDHVDYLLLNHGNNHLITNYERSVMESAE